MIIEGQYIDKILRDIYDKLTNSTDLFTAKKGKGHDLLAPKIILKDPRARISATRTRGMLISALGEFCWYMNGSANLEFIRYYIPKYPPEEAIGSIEDGYGPRLLGTGEFGRNINQIERVIDRLRKRPDTRRAVVSILEPSDLGYGRDEAPCTVALQFIRRRERLHLIAMMRSNDAYMGFPHDVFSFTMIQEFVARALGIRIGEYHHFATSLHLYERDIGKVAAYLDEGFQNPTFAMPSMPSGCQLENLREFLAIEVKIREGDILRSDQIKLPTYWRDLAIMLLCFSDLKKRRDRVAADRNFASISTPFFKNFVARKPTQIPISKTKMLQKSLDFEQER